MDMICTQTKIKLLLAKSNHVYSKYLSIVIIHRLYKDGQRISTSARSQT